MKLDSSFAFKNSTSAYITYKDQRNTKNYLVRQFEDSHSADCPLLNPYVYKIQWINRVELQARQTSEMYWKDGNVAVIKPDCFRKLNQKPSVQHPVMGYSICGVTRNRLQPLHITCFIVWYFVFLFAISRVLADSCLLGVFLGDFKTIFQRVSSEQMAPNA